MPQGIENTVRPFELRNTSPEQTYQNNGQASREPITLFIGKNPASTSLRTFQFTYNAKYTFYMDQQIVEETTSDNNGQIQEPL